MDDEDQLIDYFEQYPSIFGSNLLDDYAHICSTYLDHNVENHNAHFLSMSHQINRYLKCNDVPQSANYLRNQQIGRSFSKIKDSKLSFYINVLDSIHVLFAHSLHLGFRVDPEALKESKHRNVVQYVLSKRKAIPNLRQLPNGNSALIRYQSGTKRMEFGHRWYFWSHFKDNSAADPLNGGTPYSQWFVSGKFKDLKSEILSNKGFDVELFDEVMFKAVQYMESASSLKAMKCDLKNVEALHYGDDIKEEAPITTEHVLSILLFVDYPKMAESLGKALRKQVEGETFESVKQRVSEYRNWFKMLRETVELFGSKWSDSKRCKVQFAALSMDNVLIDQFAVHIHSPMVMTPSISSAIATAGPNGTILTLRRGPNAVDSDLMYFDCRFLGRFGFWNSNLMVGGYRPLMIENVRTMNDMMSYRRFIRPIAFLDQMLRDWTCSESEGEPKEEDAEILRVMMEEKRRCPEYINVLLAQFRSSERREKVMVNMRILRKCYLKLFGERMLNTECQNVVRLEFIAGFFGKCKEIEIEMETVSTTGDVLKLKQPFYDSLCSELEKLQTMIKEKKSDLKEVRIYQIAVDDEKEMESFKERVSAMKWTVEMVEGAKKKDQDLYFGSSISIKRV